ncbi:hypothetical protein [Coleofasciculus sp. E1-EBD-02]|uniref:hypothetical protein n=1 Tax=Coleofasciculus sp. E1-EBD-02 TaxID=3068481 RepID=UPI003303799F
MKSQLSGFPLATVGADLGGMVLTGMLVGFDFAQPTLRYIKGFGDSKRLKSVPLGLGYQL